MLYSKNLILSPFFFLKHLKSHSFFASDNTTLDWLLLIFAACLKFRVWRHPIWKTAALAFRSSSDIVVDFGFEIALPIGLQQISYFYILQLSYVRHLYQEKNPKPIKLFQTVLCKPKAKQFFGLQMKNFNRKKKGIQKTI